MGPQPDSPPQSPGHNDTPTGCPRHTESPGHTDMPPGYPRHTESPGHNDMPPGYPRHTESPDYRLNGNINRGYSASTEYISKPDGKLNTSLPDGTYPTVKQDNVKKSQRTRKIVIIVVSVVVGVLLIAAAIVLAVLLTRGDSEEQENVIFYGEIHLLQNWSDVYTDHSSAEYVQLKSLFENSMDKSFHDGSLTDSYNSTLILNFREGSIIAIFQISFTFWVVPSSSQTTTQSSEGITLDNVVTELHRIIQDPQFGLTVSLETLNMWTCVTMPDPECSMLPYQTVATSSILANITITRCTDTNSQAVICALQYPRCFGGERLEPCRDQCQMASDACLLDNDVDCSQFPITNDGDCSSAGIKDEQSMPTSTLTTPKVTTVDTLTSRQFTPTSVLTSTPQTPANKTPSTTIGILTSLIPVLPTTSVAEEDPCPSDQRVCRGADQVCIMTEWFCDGEADCEDGFDELNCDTCGSDEFYCQDNGCVPRSAVCDGVRQCADGSDENACVRQVGDRLEVQETGNVSWVAVCSQGWPEQIGEQVCETLGEGAYISTTYEASTRSQYFVYSNRAGNNFWILNLELQSGCASGQIIGVVCQPKNCGRSATSRVISLVIGGDNAEPGKWPWMAGLIISGEHSCGASIIHKDFVLTAGHCVRDVQAAQIIVVLGTTKSTGNDGSREEFGVQQIIIHSEYNQQFDAHDIALLQLSSSVTFTALIQPICLPDVGVTFPLSSLCYIAGWGYVAPAEAGRGETVEDLKQAKLRLWKYSRCSSADVWGPAIIDGYICAGYESGRITACVGDSGGPLMCQDHSNRWNVVGVASFVAADCQQLNRPPVFTEVQNERAWIDSHTECVFECRNGKCIYDQALLCNREDNCGDLSDEDEPCTPTVNCTFDDPYLCGYFLGNWKLRKAGYLPYAMYDHTHGGGVGHFLYSILDGDLLSPQFTLTSSHCVRFFYHTILQGTNDDDFTVYTDYYRVPNANPVRQQRWMKTSQTDSDKWRMGYFDLVAGIYKLVFQSTVQQVVSIDDVMVMAGDCTPDGVCQSDEFLCEFDLSTGCHPLSSKCNLVANCGQYSDEANDQCAGLIEYSCDFEDNRGCGIVRTGHQVFRPNMWKLESGEESFLVSADNTLGTNLGHFLITESFEGSQFIFNLFFREPQPHCLTFSYRLVANYSIMKVTASTTEYEQFLLSVSGDRGDSWNTINTQLPEEYTLAIKIDISADDRENMDTSYFAVDDIAVTRSVCTRLECHSDDFRCTDQSCIPEYAVCDRNMDCTDGSDEGTQCDVYKMTSCSFEHPLICGYIEETKPYTWTRQRGSAATGPDIDHTIGDNTGHYLYAPSTAATTQWEYTTLLAGTFTTAASSTLSFYYFMEAGGNILQPMANDLAFEYISAVTDGQWKFKCYPLVDNAMVNVTFLAITGEFHGGIGIDDVFVSQILCEDFTTPSPTTVQTPATGCPSGQRPCDNGGCIADTLFCNGIPDCVNGEDEDNCPGGGPP